MRLRMRSTAVSGVGFVVLLTLAARQPAKTADGSGSHGQSVEERPECPSHDTIAFRYTVKPPEKRNSAAPTVTVSVSLHDVGLSNYRTGIPEFHDCQKLLVPDANAAASIPDSLRVRYGPLVAVFASARLNNLLDDLQSAPKLIREPKDAANQKVATSTGGDLNPAIAPKAQTTTTGKPSAHAVAVGTILSYEGPYDVLGIGSGFNCLYLFYKDGWSAWIHQNGIEEDCEPIRTVASLNSTAKKLEVSVDAPTGYTFSDYPPAARWDWDHAHKWQYIGIKCGPAWCEIGPNGFKPSKPHKAPVTAITKIERRVFEIKGWYDEQYLAVMDVEGTAARPSSMWATVFPKPELDSYTMATFASSTPTETSIIVLRKDSASYYKKKLGFSVVNNIANGDVLSTKSAASANWLGTLKPNVGPLEKARVVFRDHSTDIYLGGNFEIPGSTRWRWKADDETVWQGCDAGCCEYCRKCN